MLRQVVGTVALLIGLTSVATVPAFARGPRVVDDNDRVAVHGNVHPHARPEFDMGATDTALPMEHMILSLRLAPEKIADLEQLLVRQQDPASPDFHHWLTPEEFGARFAPSGEDLAAVTGWLTSHGFSIEEVSKGGTSINFSGTAAIVKRAFGTEIHDYMVDGKLHHANAKDPSIPRGLSDVVAGVVTLHNFPRKMMNTGGHKVENAAVTPNYTSGSNHYMSPGDFAKIYNVSPLYSAGIDGTGQTIAIVGRTHPSSTNWANFRSTMGLPANPPQVIINGTDPGDIGANEDGEADLDVEWSGAVAKNATIKFVTSKSTNTTDGVDLSAQYIVNNNLAPVMSTSFGLCESLMGTTENAFYNNLWQQAAAQGITSFVSSGDAGVAGCSSASSSVGSGQGVNGLASTPYNVAVGGTQFNEGSGTFWNSSNGAGDTSALGYIPEVAWNESGNVSGGSGLWSTGGGVSAVYAKPSWQTSPGVPADGKRDVPDVALSAATHDGYLVTSQGALYAFGGTSAASPSFAGLMALVVQKSGQRQGNANARFYQLASSQYGSGGPAVFHDISAGNNNVPGVTGYACTAGYDPVTGLGSVDANAMVSNWAAATVPDFSVSVKPASLSVVQGTSASATVGTAVVGGFSNTVSLSVSGLPTGATASFSPATLAAPGSGSSTLTITTATSTIAGSYPVTISATGGATTHTVTLTLTVTASGGSTTVLSDGFEASGWGTTQVAGTGGQWSLAASGSYPAVKPHSGSRLAVFNSYFAASGSQTRIYRTVAITVPASANTATLRFWMYHDTGYASYSDSIQPQISTNKTTWSNVGSAIFRYNGTTGWAQTTIDLTAYKGQTIYLGFLGLSKYGNNEYLDDVTITAQ